MDCDSAREVAIAFGERLQSESLNKDRVAKDIVVKKGVMPNQQYQKLPRNDKCIANKHGS